MSVKMETRGEIQKKKTSLSSLYQKVNHFEKDKIEDIPYRNQKQHNSQARLKITKLFLWGYFSLIGGSFIFCLVYNILAGWLSKKLSFTTPIEYINVIQTVSLITTTLSSGVGFVIGYYFKNDEKDNQRD